MDNNDILLYKQLYKAINDPIFNDLLTRYAKKEHEKAIKGLRIRQDEYNYGHNNGLADAWSHVIDLKPRLLAIMKNLGA